MSRIEGFYLPLLRSFARKRGSARPLRVLDCGCGNGLSVDLLNETGLDAWGNDLSKLRRWQWRERQSRDRLSLADGARLPFPDRFFDALICSGVLEHIGVRETGGETYRVAPLPARDAARKAFLGELLRVLTPGGRLWLDFPNGAFPVDFWHGARAGAARFHSPGEGFLPTVREVRSTIARIGADWRVRPLSPHRRLRFEQVGRHWYGRLLRGPAALFLATMAAPGLSWLAGSWINPYLVLEISQGGGQTPSAGAAS